MFVDYDMDYTDLLWELLESVLQQLSTGNYFFMDLDTAIDWCEPGKEKAMSEETSRNLQESLSVISGSWGNSDNVRGQRRLESKISGRQDMVVVVLASFCCAWIFGCPRSDPSSLFEATGEHLDLHSGWFKMAPQVFICYLQNIPLFQSEWNLRPRTHDTWPICSPFFSPSFQSVRKKKTRSARTWSVQRGESVPSTTLPGVWRRLMRTLGWLIWCTQTLMCLEYTVDEYSI